MKKHLLTCFLLLGCQKPHTELKTEEAKLGYTIGVDIAARLKRQPQKFDFDAMLRGVEDYYLHRKLAISTDSILSLQAQFGKIAEQYEEGMQKRRKEGLEFMEANRKRAGVVELANGLQYEILDEGGGKGVHPGDSSRVRCMVKGKVVGGAVFEDSFGQASPSEFEVGKSIEGLKVVLKLMKPGMKIRAWVPSPLAFGRERHGEAIPEYALLEYELKLVIVLNSGKG